MTNEMTKEELLGYEHYLHVGGLKKFLEENQVPDDAIIVVQRVRDRYYEGFDISGMRGIREDGTGGILPPGTVCSGWKVYTKEGEDSIRMRYFNECVLDGTFDNNEQYPSMTEEKKKLFTEDDIADAKEHYTPVWCPVLYKDDSKEILFLDLHY